ncbi:MAG: glutathione S-transferase N-terminal domain-containing protein [Candidatus Lambdaproteobacteria bacterium]|nr:glutathione S-transferase N-terminal domain-containing protein [Candidatus Lambdaproteobacteria bacterium]
MKLYCTPNSPFARKVRVVAIELKLDDRMQLVQATLRDNASPYMRVNPVGRVPALETDAGHVLTESYLITEYLDTLHEGPRLIPERGPERWDVLRLEGLACGFAQGVVTWVHEWRRPEAVRSDPVLAMERDRASRCIDAFEAEAAVGTLDTPARLLPQITIGAFLGFCDYRLPRFPWREGRPKLAQWYGRFAERPSMKATAPKG